MQTPTTMILEPVAHPDPRVHRAGFALDHPYLERCWLPVIGPTSVLMLRRMPILWQHDPAVGVPVEELAAVLGLGGTGRNSPVWRTIDRLARFNFANRIGDNHVEVYTEVPPLSRRHLAALPASVRETHDQLLAAHIEGLAVAKAAAPARPSVDWSFEPRHPSVATNGAGGRSL